LTAPAPDDPLLAAIPERIVDAEVDAATGLVTLLRPRFRAGLLTRLLVPRFASPHVKVRLDHLGSHAWQRCDGQRPVADLVADLVATFPDEPQVATRAVTFVRMLAGSGFVRLRAGG
jgi:hypothetical protein